MKSKKVFLVNPPFEKIYEKTNLKKVVPSNPPIGLACIGASLLREGYEVKIFDFNLYNDKNKFARELKNFNPDFMGISFVTPLIREAEKILKIAKKINKKMILIGGGPHCSSFPESALEETSLDIVVIGEGDFTILEIVKGESLSKIKGIAYKNKKIFINKRKEPIKDLDILPFPAFHLFEINKYKTSSVISKKNPVARLETSRGCPYGCTYCNKSVFGRNFRVKSPKKVIGEFLQAKELGLKEVHIIDDGFTTNIERAKEICDLLIREKVNIGWHTANGIRADRVDLELLKKMKQAGCWGIYLGIESGNQEILNKIKKGITLEQVRNAVKWAKKAKLEVAGYFMIGLPGETEETMQQTIDFAKFLDLDLAKVSITIPLPGTEIFDELNQKNLIKATDWEDFKFYSSHSKIYKHENLSWRTIEKYSQKFYREVYLRPSFIFKRIKKIIKNKTIAEDIKTFFFIKWV